MVAMLLLCKYVGENFVDRLGQTADLLFSLD